MGDFFKKFYSLLFFFLIGISNLYAANDTLLVDTKFAVPDGIGNLFVITENNTLLKIDSNLKILISQSLIDYGIASSIECRGAIDVVVYCFNTGQLLVFDNFLKEKQRYDLPRFLKPKPNFICISKIGWWGYDETTTEMCQYRTNFQKISTLPLVIKPEKEILKIAEIEFPYPNILYADSTLSITYLEYYLKDKNQKASYKFGSIPILSFGNNELYSHSGDTLTCLTFHSDSENKTTIKKLPFAPPHSRIAKSFHTYFFMLPQMIVSYREID